MDIAALRSRIRIEKAEVTTDDNANHKETWSFYYACAATVSSSGSDKSYEAAEAREKEQIYFTVRFTTLLLPVSPKGYRIIYNGRAYSILGIDTMGDRRVCIKIKAERENG